MLTFILIICVASIIAYIQLKKGEVVRFETAAPPQQVVMASVAQVGTARRWTTATQSDNNVAFNYHKRPNVFLVIVGLIFGIIPGVVYWLLRSKRESLNVMISETPGGSTAVQIVSNGYQGKSAGRAVQSALGVNAAPTFGYGATAPVAAPLVSLPAPTVALSAPTPLPAVEAPLNPAGSAEAPRDSWRL